MDTLTFREAGPDDAERVALLHADSWRRHYRAAYVPEFLDGDDMIAFRRAAWTQRLAAPAHSATVLAEDAGALAGFVHVILDDDERWGSLVDNLHVTHDRQRSGIGTALLAHAARAVIDRAGGVAIYLWVLELNPRAQDFYRSLGGEIVEKALVSKPAEWLNGSPAKLRVIWPDAAMLAG